MFTQKIKKNVLLSCFILQHFLAISLYAQQSDIINSTSATELIETNIIRTFPIEIGYIVIIALILYTYRYNQVKKEKERIKEIYNIDQLTGLMSPPYFKEQVKKVLQSATAEQYELISVDIDLFKTINSYFSMETGNEVIKALANALKSALNDNDTLIMRRHADHFVILRKAKSSIHIKDIYTIFIAPQIKEVLGETYNLSLSFGMYIISQPNEEINTSIAYADDARIHGKTLHKTSFILFDEKMKKEYEDRINVTFRMEKALKDREFKVVYQPKINFKNLRVGGAEALVRWFTKEGNTIFPDAFIPVFEKNSFIIELDMYVFDEVCRFIKENKSRMNLPRISVNLSASSATNEMLIPRVTATIIQHGIEANEIEFEITESSIETNKFIFFSHIRALKKIGFTISIDDFGAGVSSLHRISEIDADILKLDKAFFDFNKYDQKSTIIVEDVIKMAKHLDMQIVAEGIETAEQALWLKSLKCEYAQGYYFERPIDEESFKNLLNEKREYEIIFDAAEVLEEAI